MNKNRRKKGYQGDKMIEDLNKKYRELESSEQKLIRKLVKKMKKSNRREKEREAQAEEEAFPTMRDLDTSNPLFVNNVQRALNEGYSLLIDYIDRHDDRRVIRSRRTNDDQEEVASSTRTKQAGWEDKIWIRDIEDGQLKGLFPNKMQEVRVDIG